MSQQIENIKSSGIETINSNFFLNMYNVRLYSYLKKKNQKSEN